MKLRKKFSVSGKTPDQVGQEVKDFLVRIGDEGAEVQVVFDDPTVEPLRQRVRGKDKAKPAPIEGLVE